jgi:hypothetical protein
MGVNLESGGGLVTRPSLFGHLLHFLDVVYLAGNFCFANRKNFCFLNLQLCFTDKNFKQPNCF